jgi:predicted DNA-binding protein
MSTDLKKQLLKAKKIKHEKKLVAIRLPADVHDKLLQLSEETGESLSHVMIFALRKALELKV